MAADRRRLADRYQDASRWGDDLTVIGPGMVFEGDVESPGSVVVAGRIDGQVRAAELVHVAHGAVVRGPIEAGAAKIEGAVDGEIRVRDQLELGVSGRVRGDVTSPRVAVADGAYLKGKVRAAEGGVTHFREKRGG